MALSADQRAMLELLLGRGQSYDDIAGVLGTTGSEVRSKARWALAELGGGDPDRNVALTDYLLGQADPIGRADAVRHLRDDPDDRALAQRLVDELGAIAPDAELPSLPGESRTAPHLRAPRIPSRKPAGERPPRPPSDPARTRLLASLGAGAVILVVVVLAIAGVFSSSDSGSTSGTTTTASTGTSTTGTGTGTTGLPAGSQNTVPIHLKAVGGGPGSGVATLGATSQDQPFVDVRVDNLPPPPSGSVYAAWLVLDKGKRQGYPLAPLVPYNQPYHDTFPIPSVAVPLIAGLQAIDITTAPSSDLRAEIKDVIGNKKNPKLVLPEIGDTVLRGVVPRGKQASSSGG